jgi:hypothetical protein
MNLHQTYLIRLFHVDKKLFSIVALYVIGILYCIINCNTYLFAKRCEEFPFLLYGMYSLPEKNAETYTTYSIVIDGKEVNYSRLKDSQRELILSSLAHLNFGDTLQTKQYMEWLFRYAVDMRGLETNRMDVYKLTCSYQEDGSPKLQRKDLLYTYAIE